MIEAETETETVTSFYRFLDERLLDMATEPDGLLLELKVYEQWVESRSLRHCRYNLHVRAAAAAAWQDATNTPYDPAGVKAALFGDEPTD